MVTRLVEAGLRSRVAALEQVCADLYQVAGAIGAPVRVLDQLAAAAAGKDLPYASVLPFDAAECEPLPSAAAAAMGRRGGAVTSKRKAKASRLNGKAHGGRPAKFVSGDRVVATLSAPARIRRRAGVITKRADARAQFYVKFDGEPKAEAVPSWWVEQE